MGDLSKNFSSWEFQCPISGISNPDSVLIEALQQYRDLVGVSIKVTSGGRVGESQAFHFVSETTPSKAVDIIPMGITLLEAYYKALEIPQFMKGGIGIYPNADNVNAGFLHLDVRGYFARWSRLAGSYKPHQDGLTYIKNELIYAGHTIEIKKINQSGHIYNVPYIIG